MEMVIYDPSYADPAKTKLIGKVVHYTNILEAHIPDLLNEDGKLNDTGQIIIAQKLQGFKNGINVTMVSWEHCVTSEDKYITIVSTVAVTAVTYMGFEYRSVHVGDRRGFTVKPTAKYVDECLDSVQLQNATMTPLTEQKSMKMHDETTMCDQVQHSLFRAVVGKLQYITGVRPDLMFATKCLEIGLSFLIHARADSTTARAVATEQGASRRMKHIHTRFLFIQDLVFRKLLTMSSVKN